MTTDSQDISVGVVPLCLPRPGLGQPRGDMPLQIDCPVQTHHCELLHHVAIHAGGLFHLDQWEQLPSL